MTATVLLSDVNEASGAETAALIEATGGRGRFFACDVSNPDQVKALVAVDRFGGLDGAFNNAGLNRMGDAEYDDGIWERNIGINLPDVMRYMREEVAVMLPRGGGVAVQAPFLPHAKGWR